MFLADAVQDVDLRKTAIKLHKQFAHPTADKLIGLLKNAKASSKKLEEEIRDVSDKYEVCIKFKRKSSRHVVCW